MNDSEVKQIYTQINFCTYLFWGYKLNETIVSCFCKVKSYKFNRFSIVQSVAPRDNFPGGGVLSNMGYIGMCGPKG